MFDMFTKFTCHFCEYFIFGIVFVFGSAAVSVDGRLRANDLGSFRVSCNDRTS